MTSREEAAALFNKNPKEFLSAQPASADAAAVARILYDCHPLLDVNLLGQQFGRDPKRDPLWTEILREYAGCFDFRANPIVRSLRNFLFRFRLPGEAAQIGRVMEAFAHSYFEQNCCVDEEGENAKTEKQKKHKCCRLERTKKLSLGFYLRDVDDPAAGPCCLHCGRIEGNDMPLYKCSGCHAVTFCRTCMKMSSSYGHAFVGRIGFGSACVSILKDQGALEEGQWITFDANGKGMMNGKLITDDVLEMANRWRGDNARPPFANEDAVYIFSYSLIMLTTNLHNPNVRDKMTKQQFLVTNNGINDAENLPGDYILACYDEIASEKIEVMT